MFDGKTIVLCERGINGWQSIFGDWKNWPNQAIVWIHQHTAYKAQTLLYFTGALFAGLTRGIRARNFAKLIRSYSVHDWRIIGIAHSEGTATFIKSLRMAGWPRIEALHLVCGACDADFQRTGLNWALRTGAIGEIHIYIAGRDEAMWAENTWLGKLLFAIPGRDRPLGLGGPRNVEEFYRPRVIVHREPPWENYGHSDCWLPSHFDSTMKGFLNAL